MFDDFLNLSNNQRKLDLRCYTGSAANVMTTTMDDIPGYKIVRVIGAVYGIAAQLQGAPPTPAVSLQRAAFGETGQFTNMLYSVRNNAIEKAVTETKNRDGNAVVGIRFESGELGNYYQCCACGTAVFVEKAESAAVETLPQIVQFK